MRQLIANLEQVIATKGNVEVFVAVDGGFYQPAGELRTLDSAYSAHLVARGTPAFAGWADTPHSVYNDVGNKSRGGVS